MVHGRRFWIFMAAGLFLALVAGWATFLVTAQSEYDAGLQFFGQGKYADAIPHFQKAIELDSRHGQSYLYLGRCYVSMGKYLEAIPPLRTAYSLSPEKVRKEAFNILLDALLGAALSEARTGNFGGAIGHLRDALSLDPQSGQARDELGKLLISRGAQLLLQGNVREAVESYREGISYSPNSVSAYLGLARALLKSGDIRGSMDALQLARRLDSDNVEVLNLLKDLLFK
jgi:tetratricopeptide (TPR) repeat protein